ncbi:MAG: 16S rRNA (uracil(1498)-N(3))-methyltransferase [Anaerolineaceae bacterium]|nr:16S rRNA (uracil(1498)-N(3))-methyltransferase [Anaerolineaceae bacterium]
MGTHRFFIKQVNPASRVIVFPENIAHQIQHVLRLKQGDRVIVLDGEGKAYQVDLSRIDSEETAGKIVEVGEVKSRLNVYLHLYFPLTKREKVEWILQKGTEVGVHAFHPFISQRSLVQSFEMSEKRKTRWESIIREAAEQSGRSQLPALHKPDLLSHVAKASSASVDKVIAAWVGEGGRILKDALADTRHLMKNAESIPSLGLFVGPEGGFSESEIEALKQTGAETVSLGAHVLRMETAAIILPALVLYELSDL